MTRPQAVATTVISYEAHTWDGLIAALNEARVRFGPTLGGWYWSVPIDIRWRVSNLILDHINNRRRGKLIHGTSPPWWQDSIHGIPIRITHDGPVNDMFHSYPFERLPSVELRWEASRAVLEPRGDTYDD